MNLYARTHIRGKIREKKGINVCDKINLSICVYNYSCYVPWLCGRAYFVCFTKGHVNVQLIVLRKSVINKFKMEFH